MVVFVIRLLSLFELWSVVTRMCGSISHRSHRSYRWYWSDWSHRSHRVMVVFVFRLLSLFVFIFGQSSWPQRWSHPVPCIPFSQQIQLPKCDVLSIEAPESFWDTVWLELWPLLCLKRCCTKMHKSRGKYIVVIENIFGGNGGSP